MRTNLHLVFPGNCREAFTFYEQTFGSRIGLTMNFADAPGGAPVPEEAKGLVMHTSMPLGSILLMGCDDPSPKRDTMGGFQVAIDMDSEDEVRRIFAALAEGGTTVMPVGPTFWSPMFGMLKDRFGVGWMISVPGPLPA